MPKKRTRIKSVEIDDLLRYPVRCPGCRKSVRLCVCYAYYIKQINGVYMLLVDNLATEPVRGEVTGAWQARANSKIYRRPRFVDGYGPVCYIYDEELVEEIQQKINEGTFHILDYVEREGCRVKEFDRNAKRTFPILRRPRSRKVAA